MIEYRCQCDSGGEQHASRKLRGRGSSKPRVFEMYPGSDVKALKLYSELAACCERGQRLNVGGLSCTNCSGTTVQGLLVDLNIIMGVGLGADCNGHVLREGSNQSQAVVGDKQRRQCIKCCHGVL